MTMSRFESRLRWLVLLVGLGASGTGCSESKRAVSQVDGSAGRGGNAGNVGSAGAGGSPDDGGGPNDVGRMGGKPVASQWFQAAGNSMPSRLSHAVRALNNKLFLVAGLSGGDGSDVWSSADGQSWTRVTDRAAFSPREGHGMAVFDDRLWLVGGTPGFTGDVWSSSDGATWIQATAAAPFQSRRYHSVEAFAGKLWVIAGNSKTGAGLMGDVWSSSDGVSWTLATASAFPPRQGHASAVFDNKLWVFGGEGANHVRLGDVWSSADGVTWSKMTDQGFPGRIWPGAAVLGNQLWILGGEGERPLNAAGAPENVGPKFTDVWSSPDGIHWTMRLVSAPFQPHVGSVTLTFGDQLLVVGGYRGDFGAFGVLSAVWATSDGITWREHAMGSPFGARYVFASAAINGWMFVAGGVGLEGRPGDVWSSTDGTRWERRTDAPPFGGRFRHALVAKDEHLWLIAGETFSVDDVVGEVHRDVWLSDDGSAWTLATAQAPFAARESLASVVFDGRVWVIGGNNYGGPPELAPAGAGPLNDVWWSINGAEWTRATASAAFSPRSGHAVAAYAGKMWLAGGDPNTFDVWSSADGSTWTQEAAPPIPPREGHVLLAHAGRLWLVGGQEGAGAGFPRDVWTFDGTVWKQDTALVPFPPRMNPAGLEFDGRIWILGGSEMGVRDDVWWSR